jgi:predicted nucleic-acid-binding Zn-ribbon protein
MEKCPMSEIETSKEVDICPECGNTELDYDEITTEYSYAEYQFCPKCSWSKRIRHEPLP